MVVWYFSLFVLVGVYFALRPARNALKANNAQTSGRFALTRTSVEQPAPKQSRGAVDLDTVSSSELSCSIAKFNGQWCKAAKRTCDVMISLAVGVVLSPLLLMVAVAIKLDSPGPVFYTQRRVGLRGKVFSVVKFRTMKINAEENGPQYASSDDVRATRIGRILRRLHIDEIPQIYNVLKGEMSLVGPRPERPEFIAELAQSIPHYNARHLVKPGITGWAQVKYEYTTTVEGAREKLRYDLYYIRNYSLLRDWRIMLMTLRIALTGLTSR